MKNKNQRIHTPLDKGYHKHNRIVKWIKNRRRKRNMKITKDEDKYKNWLVKFNEHRSNPIEIPFPKPDFMKVAIDPAGGVMGKKASFMIFDDINDNMYQVPDGEPLKVQGNTFKDIVEKSMMVSNGFYTNMMIKPERTPYTHSLITNRNIAKGIPFATMSSAKHVIKHLNLKALNNYEWNIIHHKFTEDMFTRARHEINFNVKTNNVYWEEFKHRMARVEFKERFEFNPDNPSPKPKEIHYVFTIKGFPSSKK